LSPKGPQKTSEIFISSVIDITMRILVLIIPGILLINSCTDINDLPVKKPGSSSTENQQITPQNPSAQSPASIYPIDRIITDANGRSIEFQIAAKQGTEIGVIKKGVNTPFVLTISKLSEKDRAYFDTLADGGDFAAFKTSAERAQKLNGRVANWNSQFYNAEKEAAQLGLPLLTACLITDDPESQRVERNVLFDRDFRNWANLNLALCSLKLDSTVSGKISSISAGENRKIASNFGVGNELAFILSIPGHSPVQISADGFRDAQSAIDAVNKVILKPTSAVPVPERTSPDKGGGKGEGE